MALGFCLGVALLMCVLSHGEGTNIPNDLLYMECHDRYFMIAVDLLYTGIEPRFEAVDASGVHPITDQYAAQCGYKVSVYPGPPLVTLHASYFSCHTHNKDDKTFNFRFNLVGNHEGKEVSYSFNKTCSPSSPWSAREVICEVNYMEVNVKSDLPCPSRTRKAGWNTTVKTAYASASSDWQVMFHKGGEVMSPMSLPDARKLGYVFDLTEGRLIFRTPYGQPESTVAMMSDVPVEVVHPTLFSRQSWVVLLVDLMAACSVHEGVFTDSHLYWVAPQARHLLSGLSGMQVSTGINGELLERPLAEERGFVVEMHNATVAVGVPLDAAGGLRKSHVSGDVLQEYLIFDFYMDQLAVDEDYVRTRIFSHRLLTTPLLDSSVSVQNRTVVDDEAFTVYLTVPDDVYLVTFSLNGKEFSIPFTNTSTYSIYEADEANDFHSYTLRVPFSEPLVKHQFSKPKSELQFSLHINYTLNILPEEAVHFYPVLVEAVVTDVSPPTFEASCLEWGIRFREIRQPFDHLWEIGVGAEPLTAELATDLGYSMHRDNHSLVLDVPLFTYGFDYRGITLERFYGTFELLLWDRKMTEVHGSFAKTCPFAANELIVCSTDGSVTVIAEMPVPSQGVVGWTLSNETCRPKQVDGTRVLFSYKLNTCGTKIKLGRGNVSYENEILARRKPASGKLEAVSSDEAEKVTVQCTYHLDGLHQLFKVYRFESDMEGVGSIIHTAPTTAEPEAVQTTTPSTRTTTDTAPATTTTLTVPAKLGHPLPAFHPPANYIKVLSFIKNLSDLINKRTEQQTGGETAKHALGLDHSFKSQ